MAESRLGAQASEALTDSNPSRQLGAISVESLADSSGVPSRRLSALSAESLSAPGVPHRRLGAMSVEILVPARLAFIGWGMPVKGSSWS